VQAKAEMEESLRKLDSIDQSDKEHGARHINVSHCHTVTRFTSYPCAQAIETDIHNALSAIETAQERSDAIMRTESGFVPDLVPLILQVRPVFDPPAVGTGNAHTRDARPEHCPGILDVMHKCCAIQLELDEYDIKKRASALVKAWEPVIAQVP
jgi:hypothetical protein